MVRQKTKVTDIASKQAEVGNYIFVKEPMTKKRWSDDLQKATGRKCMRETDNQAKWCTLEGLAVGCDILVLRQDIASDVEFNQDMRLIKLHIISK